jgi:hypothetical protein
MIQGEQDQVKQRLKAIIPKSRVLKVAGEDKVAKLRTLVDGSSAADTDD